MKIFLMLCVFILAIASCKKNNCTDRMIECLEGYIFWGGSPAADGSGWYFAVSKESQPWYHIENPPEDFKVDGIAVRICLAETNKPVLCGMCAGTPPNYYEIKEIRKR